MQSGRGRRRIILEGAIRLGDRLSYAKLERRERRVFRSRPRPLAALLCRPSAGVGWLRTLGCLTAVCPPPCIRRHVFAADFAYFCFF
jgi:hypothetical protein